MGGGPQSRVIVGVHGSLAGLCALRAAVTYARQRGAVLHAVRVLPVPPYGPGHEPDWHGIDERGAQYIARVFADALGGPPRDVPVEPVTLIGRPGATLARYACCETDLLVVGACQGGGMRRVAGCRIARHCLRRAICPVLSVPPQELARAVSGRTMSRALRRSMKRLSKAA